MKQLTCEMCGGTDFIKQDGVFACQGCGMKYSIEDARKMMMGEEAATTDTSEKATKYLNLARIARMDEDSETAAKYYGLVREEFPENWEARFYSLFYMAMECKVKDAYSMCKKMEKIASFVVSAIKNDEPSDKQVEYILEIVSKVNDVALMFLNGNSEDACDEAPYLLLNWGDELENKYSDVAEIEKQFVVMWENALEILVETYGVGEEEIDEILKKYCGKIQKYNSSYVLPESNISIHTSDSPNQATVKIITVGHTDFKTVPFLPIPIQYVAAGPDSAGGVSVELQMDNLRGKTIKYATLYVTAFNQLGEPVACTVHNEATRALSITGPIEPGKNSGKLVFDTIWYNHTITSARLHSMVVEYIDGTQEKYKHEEYNIGSATSANQKADAQLATLTVIRNESKTTIVGYNLTCILDGKESFELGYNETVKIPVKHGMHRIVFEFKGQSLVPQKCRETPDFMVNGDTTVELKRDVIWGGFKSSIIKNG